MRTQADRRLSWRAPLICQDDTVTVRLSPVCLMSVILLILPDFLVIALGWLLLHKWRFKPDFFRELEKLVYFVLFPALLFHSITRTPISLRDAYELLKATALLTGAGIVLAWLAKPDRKSTRLNSSHVAISYAV